MDILRARDFDEAVCKVQIERESIIIIALGASEASFWKANIMA